MESNRLAGNRRFPDLLLWSGLLFAFSPILLNLLRDAAEYGVGANLAVTPVLLGLVLALGRSGDAEDTVSSRPLLGGLVLTAGLALGVVGIAGESWSIARLGFPLGIIGMAILIGRPAISAAALSIWLVPIPTFLYLLTTPWAETSVARLAAAPFFLAGLDIEVAGQTLLSAGHRVVLFPGDSGLGLAVLLAELGWYKAAREGRSLRSAAARAACASLLALPLQIGLMMPSVALLIAGFARMSQLWLRDGDWIFPSLVAIVWIEWRLRGASRFAKRGPS